MPDGQYQPPVCVDPPRKYLWRENFPSGLSLEVKAAIM